MQDANNSINYSLHAGFSSLLKKRWLLQSVYVLRFPFLVMAARYSCNFQLVFPLYFPTIPLSRIGFIVLFSFSFPSIILFTRPVVRFSFLGFITFVWIRTTMSWISDFTSRFFPNPNAFLSSTSHQLRNPKTDVFVLLNPHCRPYTSLTAHSVWSKHTLYCESAYLISKTTEKFRFNSLR